MKAMRLVSMLVVDRVGNIKRAYIDAKDIIQFAELLKKSGYYIVRDSIEVKEQIVQAYNQVIKLPKAV